MAYFSIGMALHSEGSYEDVFAQLTDGLAWSSGWAESWSPPTKSAIFQARSRLGFEPLRDLFARVVVPLARPETPGSWLAERRLMAIDGTVLALADTPANVDFFGRPASSRGEHAAFPQARLVALAECGIHAILDAEIGPCSTSEIALSRELAEGFKPGMLVLADRGFYGFHLWQHAADTGADLLWRVKTNLRPRYLQTLTDGSWLARIIPTSGPNRTATAPLTVRVIDYTIEDGRENPESYRLLTTILDPADASAEELAAAYFERWEIESTFDELKTHQRGPRGVLRSQSPDLVLQESPLVRKLTAGLRRSLTWDRGKEMSAHALLTNEIGLPVYFAESKSPWQQRAPQLIASAIFPERHRSVPLEHVRDPRQRRHHQQPAAQNSGLAHPRGSLRRPATLGARSNCCDDRLNTAYAPQ